MIGKILTISLIGIVLLGLLILIDFFTKKIFSKSDKFDYKLDQNFIYGIGIIALFLIWIWNDM